MRPSVRITFTLLAATCCDALVDLRSPQKVRPSSNSAYERARREARSAAFTERRALDEWSVSKVTSGPSRGGAAISEPFAPELATSGVSGVLGFCSGKACRFVGDAAALTLGFAFVFISLLSKAGYVEINYTKVERDLLSLLDLNKDGLVDRAEYEFASKRLVSLLVDHGISSTAGFAAGFALGFLG